MANLPLADLLQDGDRRSIGNAPQVADLVLAKPARLDELLICSVSPSTKVRSRATYALMQLAKTKPALLQAQIGFLLTELAPIDQWEVRAHFCQTITLLELDAAEIQALLGHLQAYLSDPSSLVRTCAMQALSDLCDTAPDLVAWVHPLIANCTQSGTAAMRARGRKLIKSLARRFP